MTGRLGAMRAAVALLLCACGRIGFGVSGSSGDGNAGEDGAVNADGLVRGDIVFTNNVAFVSDPVVVLGSLGAATAADAICTTQANEAGLPGNYVAWISTSTSNAIDRLAGARGWVRADGVPFVDQLSDLTASHLMSPLVIDRYGVMIDIVAGAAQIATGTSTAGTPSNGTCTDLSAPGAMISSGTATTTSTRWTGFINTLPCNTGQRIYCFGTSSATALTVQTVPSRRAFMSTGWVPGGGITDADMHCQMDATTASLANPSSFRALLATSTASAASRFVDGLPWARVDGVLVANTASDLFNYDWTVTLSVDASGTYLTNPSNSAWVGANSPLVTNSTNTCNNWMASNNGTYGTCPDWDQIKPYMANCPCGGALRLYCLEQ
jgi:hypothetical protein